jgi:hypothetical protein
VSEAFVMSFSLMYSAYFEGINDDLPFSGLLDFSLL